MSRTDEHLAIDVAIADATAVVRALVRDDNDAAALEARHRNRARTVAGGDHGADGNKPDLAKLRATVIGVVAQLVE